MERDPELTGDYGYDEAHDAIGPRERAPESPGPRTPAPPPGDGVPRPVVADGDYGYDEAHDF